MAQEFNVANVNAKFTTSGLSTVQSGIDKLGLSVGKVAGLLGGLGLAFSAKNLATTLFQTTKKLEQMKMAITAVSKTAAEADATFERIKNWAELNPVNTDDAIAAFVRMRTAGVQNAEAAMTQIADLASVTSRNMADVASAVVTTEVEPLRNLGIQLDRTGKQAIIQFGEVKKAVNKDINSVRAGIIEVLQQAIPNAMERTKNSVTGSLNTMSGMWQKMQSDIMGWGTQDGGLFGSINKSLNEFRNSWQAWMDSADYKRFLDELRNALNSLMTALTGAAKTVAQITGFLWKHREAVTTLIEVYAAYRVTMSASQMITTVMIGSTNALTGSVVGLSGALATLIAEISAVAIPLTALIMLIKEAGKGMDELRNKQSQKLFGGQTTAQLQEQKKLNEQQIQSNNELIASERNKKKGLLQLDSKEAARLKAENRRLKEENALIEKAIAKNKQSEPVKTATQTPTVAPIKAEKIAETGTGAGKSETEKLIERVDIAINYMNKSIDSQIPLLEKARAKLKPYGEDWVKVTDKIKELNNAQAQINDMTNDNAVAQGIKEASASLEYYVKQLNELKTGSNAMLTVQEQLHLENILLSKSNSALSTAIEEINKQFEQESITAQQATAAIAQLGQIRGLTKAQTEQLAEATKSINMAEIGKLITEVVEPAMDMLQKQYETGVLTLPAYIAQLQQLKEQYAGIGEVITTVDERIKSARETATTFGTRMQTAIGDATKAVTELDSTALTGLADGFARAVSYGEDFGECLKRLVQDITYTITKMLMLKAVTKLFGNFFGGTTGGSSDILTLAELGGRHTGGVVGLDSPTFTRRLPKFHTGGIVGNQEELAVLKKGEGVFTKGQMQAIGKGMQQSSLTEGGTQIGSVTLNISAIDSQSFASALANNKTVVENIIVNNVMSNGNVRRTLKAALV